MRRAVQQTALQDARTEVKHGHFLISHVRNQLSGLEEEIIRDDAQRSTSEERNEEVIIDPEAPHDVVATHVWPNDRLRVRQCGLWAAQNFTHTSSATGEHGEPRGIGSVGARQRRMKLATQVDVVLHVLDDDDQIFVRGGYELHEITRSYDDFRLVQT